MITPSSISSEYIQQIPALFSRPSFNAAWCSMKCGHVIDIMGSSVSGTLAFWIANDNPYVTETLSSSMFYLASVYFDQKQEGLSMEEARIYLEHMIMRKIEEGEIMPKTNVTKQKRTFIG